MKDCFYYTKIFYECKAEVDGELFISSSCVCWYVCVVLNNFE